MSKVKDTRRQATPIILNFLVPTMTIVMETIIKRPKIGTKPPDIAGIKKVEIATTIKSVSDILDIEFLI